MKSNQQRTTQRPWRLHDDVRPLAASHTRSDFHAEPDVVDTYEQDGVVVLRGEMTQWVQALRTGLDRNVAAPDDFAFPSDSTTAAEPGAFFNSYCNWQRIEEYTDFVLRSSAAAMAATFLRSSTAQLFHEHTFVKEVGTQKATPWHHDMPYYCVDGHHGLTIYVALDDTPAGTAVRFLRGSHRSGTTFLPRLFRDGSNYEGDPDMVAVPDIAEDDERILSTHLAAGDVVVFDFRTLHGSADAPIRSRRRAFSTRWLGDRATYVERSGPTSPPMPDLGLQPGDRMRTDWFPVLWPNEAALT